MTRWIVAGLVVLNLLLGAGVIQKLRVSQPAQAQGIGVGVRGDLTTVAGNSANQTVLYMLESQTGVLYALRVDPVAKRVDIVSNVSVVRALQAVQEVIGTLYGHRQVLENTMKNKTTIWMAVLTLTAIVLGVILLSARQPEAQAAMLNVNQQNGYTMITTGVPGGDDLLIIVDKNTQKVLTYRLNGNTLELVAGRNLAR